MTATAGAVFTAADFNTHIRDNLNETAVAKATTAGRIFVSAGLNSLAERAIVSDTDNSIESITSTSYGDAPVNPGPSVTVTTGSSALVFWSCRMGNGTAGQLSYCSISVDGATTVAADDNWALAVESPDINYVSRDGTMYMFTGLTAGSNTFKMQYRVTGGTGDARLRQMFVIPL